jgi:hypothetical protein
MPLGRWKTFGECVGAQKRMGHGDESARKICGSIEAKAASEAHPDLKGAVFTECMEKATRYYDQETAERVCGAAKAEQGGSSSQSLEYGADPSMSQDMEKPDQGDGGGNISVPKEKATALVSAIMNDDLETAKRIASDIFNIEEEEAAPNKPPAKPPGKPGFPPR